MSAIKELKIMDLGRYLIGRNENLNVGHRMIANPQQITRQYLGMCAGVLRDRNARRMAAELSRM
ncbi:MAG: hypothetical protein WCI95_03065 [bacterium]